MGSNATDPLTQEAVDQSPANESMAEVPSVPQNSNIVTVPEQDNGDYSILKEGQAEILLRGNDVFYNKAQIVNRDLSIAVLRTFIAVREQEFSKNRKRSRQKEKVDENNKVTENADSDKHKDEANGRAHTGIGIKRLRVLEALAASGLRALRYAKEVDGVGSVVALDKDEVAVQACLRNIKLNGSVAVSKVQALQADSRIYMLTHEKAFDVVDLDPYGSPSIFLDSAVQTIDEGGLLMCTATDMAVLCGNNGEVCYSKYGSYPVRGKYCHEMALRILLASIESHANRYKRYVVPVLSVSVDFYIRVFVRIYTSPNAVKASPTKLSYLYQCVGCDTFHLQQVARVVQKNTNVRYLPGTGPTILPDCQHCGKRFNMGGPIWTDPIHNPDWISLVLKELNTAKGRYPAYDKVHGVLTAISEELLDVPLFLSLHSVCATLKCTPPPASMFRYALVNAGYRVSGAHASPLGLKTDAPMDVIWDIMRCWVKSHPVKPQSAEMPGSVILSKEPVLEANFKKVNSALSMAKAKGVPRFIPNPEEYWGPKPRAGRPITSKHVHSHGQVIVNGCHPETDVYEESMEVEVKQASNGSASIGAMPFNNSGDDVDQVVKRQKTSTK